jgi:ribonuclease G
MTRELFVSSTPHETKVGLVEDDQLAEVYLERENEYTLAGSIYKGKVTRVLPGMQSAFVDIGLERDAFLYVSDFMELESQDEDLEDVPATPAVRDYKAAEASPEESAAPEVENESGVASDPAEAGESKSNGGSPEPRDERGGWRNRRRRRGRRDRGNGGPDSRHARPVEREARADREEYGPPPGYQPIILPGESISKYRGRSSTDASQLATTAEVPVKDTPVAVSANFPDDEPLFTQPGHESEIAADVPPVAEESEFTGEADRRPTLEVGSAGWDREQKRLHEMNVAAVFGGDAAEEESEEHAIASAAGRISEVPTPKSGAAGTVEHEEIDEEEADLASYVEELEEDAAFDEMEEETHIAEAHAPGVNGEISEGRLPSAQEIAASAENGSMEIPFSAEPVSEQIVEAAQTEEVDEAAEEDAELEDAQAQAEALLDSEGRENGTVDARAELRARRSGGTGSDRERADRQERRAHYQPYRTAGTVPGLHANRESHRGVAQNRFRRRAPALEADHPERARERPRRFHRAHGSSRRG